ncbi:hypothetical protein RBSWK_03586 [Rhodopirellula baltica SWK14]|uniref:Uncharacterized protein n=1 Tax=Rhodopirellula baltica SWK14 TaxID=993516 RepID=L7CE03_RHOBT|nr:hypothetical protein RBSWK_03586 [Rhodopirellula baltica SWK14]
MIRFISLEMHAPSSRAACNASKRRAGALRLAPAEENGVHRRRPVAEMEVNLVLPIAP